MTNLEWIRRIVRHWVVKHNLGHIAYGYWDNTDGAIDYEDAFEMWLNAEHEPWPGEEVVDDE